MVRVWRDKDARDSKFWNLERERVVRVDGRKPEWWSSSEKEKEVACGNMAPIKRNLRGESGKPPLG